MKLTCSSGGKTQKKSCLKQHDLPPRRLFLTANFLPGKEDNQYSITLPRIVLAKL